MDRPQRLARQQEGNAAEYYGGRTVARSGSGDVKGDVLTDTEYIECKHTERRSYSLKLAELLTAAKNAILSSRRMVFEVEFTNPRGLQAVRFVVLNRDEYKALVDERDELRREVDALNTDIMRGQ